MPIATLKHEMEVRRIGLSQFGVTHDPGRHAAVGARAEAPAALPAPPLPGGRGGEVGRRRVLHLRGPDRRRRRIPPRIAEVVPAAHAEGRAPGAARHPQRRRRCAFPSASSQLIPPTASGYGGGDRRDLREAHRVPTFDPIGAATIAADITVDGAASAAARGPDDRAARTRRRRSPASATIVTRAGAAHVERGAGRPTATASAIQEAVQSLVVQRLMDLAADTQARAARCARRRPRDCAGSSR